MAGQETEILSVVVVLKSEHAEDIPATVARLQVLGLQVESTDDDKGVVEGTIDAVKIAGLRDFEGASYVRIDGEFICEPPAADAGDDEPGHNSED